MSVSVMLGKGLRVGLVEHSVFLVAGAPDATRVLNAPWEMALSPASGAATSSTPNILPSENKALSSGVASMCAERARAASTIEGAGV
jgi:hypothetical protein